MNLSLLTKLRLCWRILFCFPLTGEGETTSPAVAKLASALLGHWDADVRSVAASALTQAANRKPKPSADKS